MKEQSKDVYYQSEANYKWIVDAHDNDLTVGSEARILYSDTLGRIELAV